MSASAGVSRSRQFALAAVAVLLALLAFCYRDTLRSVGAKWLSDMTYSHGVLVLPIALWLVWRVRRAVAVAPWAPSAWGVLGLLLACLAWTIAHAAGVLVIEQLAVVTMVSAIVLAVLGPRAYRPMAFPLGFLVFAVPFGRGLVPGLMQVTADITVAALRLSGIPVLRRDMLLSIPAGDFEVARACSGLNYLMTGIVLGSLYAYLTFKGWRKRVAFVVTTLAVLVFANGIRAYLTIAVAHLSDLRYGTGYDHIVFGRVLFLAVIVTMFWIGQRWRDPVSPADPVAVPRNSDVDVPSRAGIVLAACAALIVMPPWYLASMTARAAATRAPADGLIALPGAGAAWRGPLESEYSWRPQFSGAIAERAASFVDATDGAVELYVAVYALGSSGDGEMISYRNRLYPHENRSLLPEESIRLPTGSGTAPVAHELVVPDPDGGRIVRYWYMIGEEATTSRTAAKWLEVIAMITGRASQGRIVTLAAPASDPEARQRLDAFVRDHGPCVQGGFAPGHCAD